MELYGIILLYNIFLETLRHMHRESNITIEISKSRFFPQTFRIARSAFFGYKFALELLLEI